MESKDQFKEIKYNTKFILDKKFEISLKGITWKEYLKLNAMSFDKDSEGNFLNFEKKKRLILNHGIEKIIDLESGEAYSENLLDILSYSAVENIWNEYQKILHISSEEVNIIYNSAKKYFQNSSDEYYPILPEIIEIDYISKGIVRLSKSEFDALSNKEFEIMQLILSVKNESKKNTISFPEASSHNLNK